ncbi:MAG: hypothetical protein ACRDEA_02405 [Microcystaceae cyanobacterium]
MLKIKFSRFNPQVRFLISQGWILLSIPVGLLLLHLGESLSSFFWRELGLILFGGGVFLGLINLFILHFRLSIGVVSLLNLLEILALSQNLLNKNLAIQGFSVQLFLTVAILNSLIGFAFFVAAKIKRGSYERKFSEFLLRRNANQVNKERFI